MNNFYLTFLIILVSIFSLLFAFYLQIEMNLAPCPLCIWQRWPHVINIIIASIILTLRNKKVILLFAGFTNMFFGTILSLYHFGLEEGYWYNVFSCSGIQNFENFTPKDLVESLKNTPISACEKAQWTFFDFSLAGWNMLICGILVSLWGVKTYSSLFRKQKKLEN